MFYYDVDAAQPYISLDGDTWTRSLAEVDLQAVMTPDVVDRLRQSLIRARGT